MNQGQVMSLPAYYERNVVWTDEAHSTYPFEQTIHKEGHVGMP